MMGACGSTDGYSLKPPDLRARCALDEGHDGLCDWHPAYGREPGMSVREVIAELQRFDPAARVVVSGRPVRDVGRRERNGLVHPQLYLLGGL